MHFTHAIIIISRRSHAYPRLVFPPRTLTTSPSLFTLLLPPLIRTRSLARCQVTHELPPQSVSAAGGDRSIIFTYDVQFQVYAV